jgi:hypothetical protein
MKIFFEEPLAEAIAWFVVVGNVSAILYMFLFWITR